MQVRWGSCLSDSFLVSNGVRQGSILSPHLFAVYLDGLLIDLSESGVGCHWGCSFAGAFGYADDIVLLAPCASSLRKMLEICSSFAMSHNLVCLQPYRLSSLMTSYSLIQSKSFI